MFTEAQRTQKFFGMPRPVCENNYTTTFIHLFVSYKLMNGNIMKNVVQPEYLCLLTE